MKSIGIDIGKRRCIVCTMDRNGTVLEETGYENTYAAATAFARKARRKYGKCQAVCESTGNLWIKTYEAFEDRGIPIELANPMKARAIAEASVKTDKVDARTLAHLLRTNLIARCHVAERGVRGVRQLLRERNNLVKARTQAINRLHNLLDRYDLNPKDFAQDIWREKALRALDSKSLADPNDDYVLHRYVRGIRHHNAELGLLEKKIAGHASASEDARILMSMTGIDYYAAMLLASEIDGIGRFASPRKLVSWAGMCPTVHQSGNAMYHGRMKKDSNRKVNSHVLRASAPAGVVCWQCVWSSPVAGWSAGFLNILARLGAEPVLSRTGSPDGAQPALIAPYAGAVVARRATAGRPSKIREDSVCRQLRLPRLADGARRTIAANTVFGSRREREGR